MSNAIAIILAAGTGNRAGGGVPKQFRPLLGKPVLLWSLEAFQRHPDIKDVVIVCAADANLQKMGLANSHEYVVAGGRTRAESVQNALKAITCEAHTPVLIHDAARPGLRQAMITNLLAGLADADGVAPSLPVNDALKDISGDHLQTIDRTPLRRVQTPQVFRYADISAALEDTNLDIVDDLAALEKAGKTIKLIAGDTRLHKITYEEDFAIVEQLLSPPTAIPRMGTGYDVHQFGEGDHVTLCGVKIMHTHGLVGHSDADIGWHALTDAILGAVALGDIGDHFPPSDPQWKDADSGTFLAFARQLALEAGYTVANVDITLICEAPKIKPHREAMREKTAQVLQIPIEAVSVKATTTERLGFTGRAEGMAGQAAAVLTPIHKPA